MPPQTFIPVARAGPGRGVPGRGGGRGVPAPGRDTAGGLRRLPDKGYFAEVDGKGECGKRNKGEEARQPPIFLFMPTD